jgi:acyl-coenzyme A thioesterase PaaI-like protein
MPPSDDEWEHPAAVGRQAELASFASTVRRLVRLTVVSRAPAVVLHEANEALRSVADRLDTPVPDPVPSITEPGPQRAQPDAAALVRSMAFDGVVGPYNPLAPPVNITLEPPLAIGRVTFSSPYEGPPGCVHGGVLAGVFDIVFSAANIMGSVAGPTVSLSLRYRRPTLLGVEAVFEAWVAEVAERRVRTAGRLVQDGQVTVEADGAFARLDRKDTLSLKERSRR